MREVIIKGRLEGSDAVFGVSLSDEIMNQERLCY